MSAVLVALPGLPLLAALLLLAPVRLSDVAVRWYGVVVSALVLVGAVVLASSFDTGRAAHMQFQTDLAWASSIGLRFHLGLDGVSLPLVVLTALLVFLCAVYGVRHPAAGASAAGRGAAAAGGSARLFVALLLTLEVGMVGTFVALDLVLFFVFFEVVLVPMYVVIALWGGAGRRHAARKFILYTLFGSGLLLVGLLLVAADAGTLDMVTLAHRHGAGLSHGTQVAAFVLIGLGFAVKAPMWPLHTWLPDAHTEAPTVGSVLLAGVLLKMGTYGFVRIALPTAPEGARFWAPWLGALAVVGIVYGALVCLAQRELKRMIAYSSVGHMGFVLLGISTLTPVGVNAALFGNIAHGLITGLLFFLVGGIKERYGTLDLEELGGGMLTRAPRLAAFLTFAAVASLGLPGLAGFWGEMLALLGAYRPGGGLPRGTFVTFMALGGLGAVLTAAYFLRLLSKVAHGPALTAAGPSTTDAHKAAAQPASRTDQPASEEDREAAAERMATSEHVPPSPDEPGDVGEPGGTEGVVGGREPVAAGGRLAALTAYEYVAWVPLIALTLVVGLWPKALLDLTDSPVHLLLGGFR